MKNIALLLIFFIPFTKQLRAQAGNLDSTFGINGTVTTLISANSYATDLVLQSDGKIVAAGYSLYGITLVRYNDSGSLDSSFGTNGIVTIQTANQSWGASVAIQPDGKIIISGGEELGWILFRYRTNGMIDSSFGINGELFLQGAPGGPIKLQPDGKIIMAGTYSMDLWPNAYNIGMARCDSNGTLDNSFQFGAGTFDGYYASAYSIALQPDGKIISAGKTDSDQLYNPCFGIGRFNTDGSADGSFGINGHVTTKIGSYAIAHDLALQSDGKIVAAGGSRDSSFNPTEDFTLSRYNMDGSLDNSFDGDGIVITHFSSGSLATAVAIQSDGKIVAVGVTLQTIALARYNIDGSLDNSFGTGGIVTNGYSTGYGVAIQQDEKILTAGKWSSKFTLIRYLSGLEVGVIDFSIDDLSTLIYPNPVYSQATVQYSLINEESISISLYNIQGSKVQTFINNEARNWGDHKEVLNLDESLPSGNYVLSISNGINSQGIKITKMK